MKNKIKEFFENTLQTLAEQPWAQELKGKWEELDIHSKLYCKIAAAGAVMLILISGVVGSILSVHKLKQELMDKKSLLTLIQKSAEELRKLQDSIPPSALQEGARDSGPWSTYFETLAANSGMDKSNVNVSPEKPGTSGEQSKESLVDIDLKHVNVKQIINYAVSLENGPRPTKIRNFAIDTKGDPTGYMDASFAVSGFTMVVNSK